MSCSYKPTQLNAHKIGQSFHTAYNVLLVECKRCFVNHKTSRVLIHISSSELHSQGTQFDLCYFHHRELMWPARHRALKYNRIIACVICQMRLIFVPVELPYAQSDRVSLCLLTITFCLFLRNLHPVYSVGILTCLMHRNRKMQLETGVARFQNVYCAVLFILMVAIRIPHWPCNRIKYTSS